MNQEEILKAIHLIECDKAYCLGAGYNDAAYLYGLAAAALKDKLK